MIFRRTSLTLRALATTCILLLAACGSIEIRKTSPEQRAIDARRTVLDGEDVGVFTRDVLARRSIDDYRKDPVGAIRTLDAEMRKTRSRPLAAAIAELGYLQTRRWTAVDFQALAATIRYSYAYLFDPKLEPAPSQYDARFRDMCDLYNAAIADWVRALRANPLRRHPAIRVDWYIGASTARVTRNDLAWGSDEFDSVEVAADFEVEGLSPPAMRRGIGVPCLATRSWDRERELKTGSANAFRYLPSRVSFPMTMLVQWPDDCSILDETQAEASIEVIDPIESVTVPIAGNSVPIEVDYTTPIAVMAASEKPPSGIEGLLHADRLEKKSGLIMFQPYRKNRITVLFVHGLASGPETWLPLYNRLLSDETIRTRYQFAFWFYPTGLPALESAANLRHALQEAHSHFGARNGFSLDDEGVICAHSLGGVISSTLITDTGDVLWNVAFKVPPEELPVDEKVRNKLKDRMIFEHLPFVKRVVYYSSPHRGAPDANVGLVQWASGLIHLPQTMFGAQAKLNKYVRDDVKSKRYTVAQSLGAHNPVFEALADLPVTPGVTYHSIIGDKNEAGRKGGSDGIVPYWSSHLDGAESEAIYKSGHSVQHTMEAAMETRRILLEHLAAVDAEKK